MQRPDPFNLPQKFTRTITGMFGEGGRKWLAALPNVVEEVAAEWSLTIEKPFKNLSYHFVAPCRRSGGEEAVLKIGFPGEKLEFFNEARTLKFYNGVSAVKLLGADDTRCAMLLEKITPGASLGELCLKDDKQAVGIAAQILKNVIRAIPQDAGYHLLKDWIGGLRNSVNTEFPRATVERAQKCYGELTGKNQQGYLLHGDFHHENILSATREPYLLIDPKGL